MPSYRPSLRTVAHCYNRRVAYKRDKERQLKQQREWYDRNKKLCIGRVRARERKIENEIQDFVASYLDEHPCIDCGESDIVVLEFDHRNPDEKKFTIACCMHNGRCLATLIAEIEKCDVRCANCHRRKTANQFGFWKTRPRNRLTLRTSSTVIGA